MQKIAKSKFAIIVIHIFHNYVLKKFLVGGLISLRTKQEFAVSQFIINMFYCTCILISVLTVFCIPFSTFTMKEFADNNFKFALLHDHEHKLSYQNYSCFLSFWHRLLPF